MLAEKYNLHVVESGIDEKYAKGVYNRHINSVRAPISNLEIVDTTGSIPGMVLIKDFESISSLNLTSILMLSKENKRTYSHSGGGYYGRDNQGLSSNFLMIPQYNTEVIKLIDIDCKKIPLRNSSPKTYDAINFQYGGR